PLAGRTVMYALGRVVPIAARHIFIISAPSQGIEITPLPLELSELGQVAQAGGRLISSGGGAWVFEWSPPAATKLFRFSSCTTLPAWAMSTKAGKSLTRGPVSSWG